MYSPGSDSFGEIKAFVQKVGTNHQLLEKSASFSFNAPWDFLAQFLASRASRRGEHSDLSPAKKLKSFELWWAVDLNHTRRNEQSGFQAVTQPSGFTHPHRGYNFSLSANKNNPGIASGVVFSSLGSMVLPLENLTVSIADTIVVSTGL